MDAPTSTGIPTQPEPIKPWKQVAEESNIFSLPAEQRIAEYDKWSQQAIAKGIRDGDFDSPDTFSQFKLLDIRTRKNLASDDIVGPSDEDILADYNSFSTAFQDTQKAFASQKPTPEDNAIQDEVLKGKRNAAFVRGQMVFNPTIVNDPQKYREAILESDAPPDIKMLYAGLRPEMEKSATITRRRELANSVITRDVADKVVNAIQEGTELFSANLGTPQSPALKKNKEGVWSVVDPEYSDIETSLLARANAKANPLADAQYKPLAAINEYQKKYGLSDEQVQQDYMEALIENAPTAVNRWVSKATSVEDYVKQLDSTVRVKNRDVAPEVRVQDPNLFFDEEGYNAAVDKANAPDEAKNLAKEARTQFADAVAGDIYNNLLANRDDFRKDYAKDVVEREDMAKAITRYYKDKKDQAWYDDVGEFIGQTGTALEQGGMNVIMTPSAVLGMFGSVKDAEDVRYATMVQNGQMQAEEAVANRTGGAGAIKLTGDVARILPDLAVQMAIGIMSGGALSYSQAAALSARTGISKAAARTAIRQAAITGEKAALKTELAKLIPNLSAQAADDVATGALEVAARTMSNNPLKGGVGTQKAIGSAYAGLTSAGSTFGQVYTEVRAMGKSPEESIGIARTAGITAGAITGALTHTFGVLGRGGVEDFASMGRKAGEFTIRDIMKSGVYDVLTTQEGRQLARSIASGIAKDALHEGVEEGLDQALNLISQYATNPSPEAQNRKVSEVINESLYATLLGGIAGGGANIVGQARVTAPGITAQQMQAEILGADATVAPDVAPPESVAPAPEPAPSPAPVVQSADPVIQEVTETAKAIADAPDTSQTAAALEALAKAAEAGLPKPEFNLPVVEKAPEPVAPAEPAAPVNAEEVPVEQPAEPATVEPETTENMNVEIESRTAESKATKKDAIARISAVARRKTTRDDVVEVMKVAEAAGMRVTNRAPSQSGFAETWDIEYTDDNGARRVGQVSREPSGRTVWFGTTTVEPTAEQPTEKAEAPEKAPTAEAPAEKPVVTQTQATAKPAAQSAQKLPKELSGAKPRFGYGSINTELSFASDFDKAAYIVAQDKKNSRHDDYMAWAVKASGLTEDQVKAHGTIVRQAVKKSIEPYAKSKRQVPAPFTVATTPVNPSAQAVKPVAKPEQRTPIQAVVSKAMTESLPRELAGAKPRYAFKDKNFTISFISDFDKAAYIVAQPEDKQNKQHAKYLKWATDASGLTAEQVQAHGSYVRQSIKKIAETAEGGTPAAPKQITIGKQYTKQAQSAVEAKPAEKATPEKQPAQPSKKRVLFRGFGRKEKGSVYSDRADGPVLGSGKYYAFNEEEASRYGPEIEQVEFDTSNALVVSSDKEWSDLTKKLGWRFPNPSGRSPETAKQEIKALTNYLKAKGYTAVVVDGIKGSVGDSAKLLKNVFGTDQVFIPEGFTEATTQAKPASAPELTPQQQDVVVFMDEQNDEQEERQKPKKKRITPGEARKVGIAKQIGKLGIQSNDPESVIGALKKIAAKPPQPHHARIAKDLLSVLEGSETSIVLVASNDPRIKKGDETVNGWYDPATNTAYINLDGPHELGIEETILHELVHASGEKVIRDPQTDAQKRILGDLQKQMEAATKNAISLGQSVLKTKETDLEKLIALAASKNNYALFDILYGVSSLSEYHAHATTSKAFQKFLSEYKEGSKRNFFERFVNSITRLLSGQKTAEGSDAEKSYATLLDLMRKSKGDVRLSNTDVVQSRARGTVTAEMDAAFADAYAKGDTEAAQRMVDEAAKAAGYTVGPLFHGTNDQRTNGPIIIFKKGEPGGMWNPKEGFFFSNSIAQANSYTSRGAASESEISEIKRMPRGEERSRLLMEARNKGARIYRTFLKGKLVDVAKSNAEDAAKFPEKYGKPGDILRFPTPDNALDDVTPEEYRQFEYVAFESNQIKLADPFVFNDSGELIPLSQRFNPASQDIRYSRARGRFDLVDAVRAASSGDASTPFVALNEAINANTELTRRIQAESERRSRAYARGKGAILEQIIRAGNTGRLPQESIKPLTDFVNSVSAEALADTRISLSARPQNSTFDFTDSLVTLALNGLGSDPNEIDRTAVHEFWHGLSRFLPDDEIEKMRVDYVAAVKEYISKNPWFVPFIGRTHLSETQYDELSRLLSKDEMDAIPWKNWETLDDGRRIRGIKWSKENYRLFRLDEWVAETMADLVRRKQERPTTILGKMARLFRDFIDTLKQALGNPYLRALDAMTMPDEAFDAVIQRYGPIEDNPPVMYGGPAVGVNNQFILGMYAGEKALENLPEEARAFKRDSLGAARAMAAAGKTSEEIRAVTGWFPGKYDGKMRWEIPDNDVKPKEVTQSKVGPPTVVRGNVSGGIFTESKTGNLYVPIVDGSPYVMGAMESPDGVISRWYEQFYPNKTKTTGWKNNGKLDEVISHPALFESYPELRNVNVVFTPLDGYGGDWNREANLIRINSGMTDDQMMSLMLHEIQHAIQNIEEFPRGSNKAEFSDYTKEAQVRFEYNAKILDAIGDAFALKSYLKNGAESLGEAKRLFREEFKKEPNEEAGQFAKFYTDDELNKEAERAKGKWEQARKTIRRGNPQSQYMKTAGEIEARDVQARQSFTPEQRAAIAPYSSENIAPDDALVRFSKARGIVSDAVVKFAPQFNVVDAPDGPSVEFDGRSVTVNPEKLENLEEYEVQDLANRAVVAAIATPKDPIAAGIIQQTMAVEAYNFDSESRKGIRKSLADAHRTAHEFGMAPLAMELGNRLFEFGGATDADVRKSMARGIEGEMAASDIANIPSEYEKQLAIKRSALTEKVAPGFKAVASILSMSKEYDNYNFDVGTKRAIIKSLNEAYSLAGEFGLSDDRAFIKSWIIQNEGVLKPGASRYSTKKRTPGEENAEFEKYLERVATSDPDPEERKWATETAQSFVDISAKYYGYTKERWHGTRSHWTTWDASVAGGVINTALDKEIGVRYGLAGGGSRADYPIEDTMFWTDDSEYEYSDGKFKKISGDYGPDTLTIANAQKLADNDDGSFYPKTFQNKRLYVKADNMLDLETREGELALLGILKTIDISNAEFYQKTQFQQVLSEASKKPYLHSPNESAGTYWPTTKNEARFGAWRDLIIPELKKAGYDGIRLRDDSHATEAVFDAEQIKSAEPFTYDDNGNLIPTTQRFNAAIPDIRYSRARGTELVTRVSGPALAWKKFISGFRSRGMVSQETYDAYRDSDAFKKANAAFVSFIAKDFTNVTNKLFGEGGANLENFRVFSRDATTGEATVSSRGFETRQKAEAFAATNRYKDYIVSTGQDLINQALGSNGPTLKEDVRNAIEKLTKKGLDDIAKSIEAYKEEYLDYWNLVVLETQADSIDEKQVATLRDRKEQWMAALRLRSEEQKKLVDDARKKAVQAAIADAKSRIVQQQQFAKAYLPDELVHQIERAREKIDELSARLTGINWLMEGSELQMVIEGLNGVYVTRSYEAFETSDKAAYVAWLNEAYNALTNRDQVYDPIAMERIMPLVRHIKNGIMERRIEDLKKENDQRQVDAIMDDLMADSRQVTQVDRIPGQPIEGTEYEQLIRAVAKRDLLRRRSDEKKKFLADMMDYLARSGFASGIANPEERQEALKDEATRIYDERYAEQEVIADMFGRPQGLQWAVMTDDEAHDIANVERALSESPNNVSGSKIWTSSISGTKHSSFYAAVNDDFQSNLDFITKAPTSKTGNTTATANDWRRLGDKILEHKNDVPAFLRTFLGEKDNPLLRVSDTILKQSHLIAVGELYRGIAEIGEKAGWLVHKEMQATDRDKYGTWVPLLSSKDADQGYENNPLKGMYADPVMAKAIDTLLAANQPSNSAFKIIAFVVGASLWNVTAGSVRAIARNLYSLPIFLMNSGILGAVINPTRWPIVAKNIVLASRIVQQSMEATGKVSGGQQITNKGFKLADKFWTGLLSVVAAQRPALYAMRGAASMAEIVGRIKEQPTGEAFQEIYLKAVRLGVANDNVQKEAIHRLLDIEEQAIRKPKDKNMGRFAKALKLEGAVGFGSYLLGTMKSTLQQRSQLYGAPDDFTKIMAWLNEMDTQANIHAKDDAQYKEWVGEDGLFSKMPDEFVKKAADNVTNLIQSHSRVWAHITQMKKAGFGALAAPFAAARAEFYRNAANAYIIAFEEMRSKNKREQMNGGIRFASALMAHIAMGNAIGAVVKTVFSAFADDDEIVEGSPEYREAVRRLGPEYAKNKNATYILYKNGTFDWVDLSFANPFAFVWDSITAARRGATEKDVEDNIVVAMSKEILEENIGTFAKPQIALDAFAAIRTGYDPVRGVKIWDSQADSFTDKLEKSVSYYLKQAGAPGDYKDAMKIWKASRGVEENGRQYKVGTEVGAVFLGTSIRTVNITDALEQKLAQAKDTLGTRITPLYKAPLRNANDVEMESVAESVVQFAKAHDQAVSAMQKSFKAAETLLEKTPNAKTLLRNVMSSDRVRMNQKIERAIMTGGLSFPEFSDQTLQKMGDLGKKHDDPRLKVAVDTLKEYNQKKKNP